MLRRRAIQLTLSLAIGGACLWLAFRDVKLDEAQQAISRIPIWVYFVYIAGLILQFFMRTLRWSLQVRGQTGALPPFRDAMAINAVSFAAVFLMPFRLGEFIRPYLSAQRGYMRKTTALAQSAVERVVDGLVTTVFFAAVLLLLDDTTLPPEVTYAGWFGLLVFGGASVVLALGVRSRAASERFWRKWLGLFSTKLADRLVAMLQSFLDGIASLDRASAFGGYIGLTVAYWLLNGASIWLVMWAMGFGVGLVAAYFTLCFLVISVMLPAPPGNVGNFHAFTKWALVLMGVAEAPAVAFAVVLHVCQVLTLAAGAAYFILRGDIRFERLREAARGD